MIKQMKKRPRWVPIRDWGDRLVINTGLSVVVAGHLITVERDEEKHLAQVRVSPVDNQPPMTEEVRCDVKEASDLLAKRAARFLGKLWKVTGWEPPAPALL